MMGPNRSTAVMQRRVEPHSSLDDFPTPPWATRALCRFLRLHLMQHLQLVTVQEPAANRGHMVRVLAEEFDHVTASDVHDYGAGFPQMDYLMPDLSSPRFSWTITNPPFRLAVPFIQRSLFLSHIGVAVLVRSAFLEGVARHRELFAGDPPTHILQFSERVVMHKGCLSEDGSTATAYAWVIWFKPHAGKPCEFHWTGPVRRCLERPGDYPESGLADIDWGRVN